MAELFVGTAVSARELVDAGEGDEGDARLADHASRPITTAMITIHKSAVDPPDEAGTGGSPPDGLDVGVGAGTLSDAAEARVTVAAGEATERGGDAL